MAYTAEISRDDAAASEIEVSLEGIDPEASTFIVTLEKQNGGYWGRWDGRETATLGDDGFKAIEEAGFVTIDYATLYKGSLRGGFVRGGPVRTILARLKQKAKDWAETHDGEYPEVRIYGRAHAIAEHSIPFGIMGSAYFGSEKLDPEIALNNNVRFNCPTQAIRIPLLQKLGLDVLKTSYVYRDANPVWNDVPAAVFEKMNKLRNRFEDFGDCTDRWNSERITKKVERLGLKVEPPVITPRDGKPQIARFRLTHNNSVLEIDMNRGYLNKGKVGRQAYDIIEEAFPQVFGMPTPDAVFESQEGFGTMWLTVVTRFGLDRPINGTSNIDKLVERFAGLCVVKRNARLDAEEGFRATRALAARGIQPVRLEKPEVFNPRREI